MQVERLLDIVFLLLNKKQVTAKELAQRFQVSTRTIYRDMDTLSLAGIPVYAAKGKGGGLRLMSHYTIDKFLLSEQEQREILFALQSLQVAQYPDADALLDKIGAVFQQNKLETNWIEVDFSHWGSGKTEQEKFKQLKEAILNRIVLKICYSNTKGQDTSREIEPLKLVFKTHAWYLHAFCRSKQETRLFRISRIRSLSLTDEQFTTAYSMDLPLEAVQDVTYTQYFLKFSPHVSYRVFDDFPPEDIVPDEDGCLMVRASFPLDEWAIGYFLSYGDALEVLAPDIVQDMIQKRAAAIISLYRNK